MRKNGEWLAPEPALKHAKGDYYKILDDVVFKDIDGNIHKVEAGFLSDLYSKPWICEFLVGSNFSDDNRPAILHDKNCYDAIENKKKGLPYESFKAVNDRFYRAMKATGSINSWKCFAMRWAVSLNPDKW